MALDRRRKGFHYRHAVFFPSPAEHAHTNLQSILKTIFKSHLKSINERCFFPDHRDIGRPENDHKWPHFFVNCVADNYSMLCLEIMYIEPGSSVPIIETDYAKSEIECQALQPPAINGDDSREFLDSIAYVAVLENHVMFMQSKAIGIKDIEEYFNFVISKTNTFGEADAKLLFQSDNRGLASLTLKQKTVKNVRLNLPLANSMSSLDVDDGMRVLETLIGPSRVESLKEKIGIGIADLKIDISFGYKYTTSQDNQEILSNIAQGLLDSRDEELEIELKGAGRIVGDEIQIKKQDSVTYTLSLPDRDDVYRIMANWLVELLETGVIEP